MRHQVWKRSNPFKGAISRNAKIGGGSVCDRSLTEFTLSIPEGFEMTNAYLVVIPSGRLCENTVHGSTRLTTNGVVSLEIEYLSVRPEHRRRAPREFSHSLSFEMTMLGLRAFVRNQNPKPQI